MKNAQHVIPNGCKWSVKKAGSLKASRTFDTKREATVYGKKIAMNQNVSLYIHSIDGRIESADSSTLNTKNSSTKKGARK